MDAKPEPLLLLGCDNCPRYVCEGDVEMCVHCYQWWTHTDPILPRTAASLARAPMHHEDVLAALDRAAQLMERE
jgi:hypothetical protein